MKKILFNEPVPFKALVGANPQSRFAADTLRRRMAYSVKHYDHIVIDFAGVETMSPSFAEELFFKLTEEIGSQEYLDKIVYKNISPYIQSIISSFVKRQMAVEQASNTRSAKRRLWEKKTAYKIQRIGSGR
jgi:hypothetical protein